MEEKKFKGFDDRNIEKEQAKFIEKAKNKDYDIVPDIPKFLEEHRKNQDKDANK